MKKKNYMVRDDGLIKTIAKDVVLGSFEAIGFRLYLKHPRGMCYFMKEHFGKKPIVGVEIGTLTGLNSLELMQNLNIKKLYIVDPYDAYVGYNEKRKKISLKFAEKRAKLRLRKYKNKIVWVKKFSGDAIKEIKEKVDFVYIDGNHAYDFVKDDIKNYYPIVKKNGVFGGHDYFNLPRNKELKDSFGVYDAVKEFVKKTGHELNFHEDWWVVK